jgi:hypothetical protein
MRLRSSDSDRRLLPEYASATHLDTRSHGNTRGSTALLPSRTDALLPLAWRISSIYLYSPDQLSADAILSCNRDRIARLNWYHMRKSPGGGFCDGIQQLPAARKHPTFTPYYMCSLQPGQRAAYKQKSPRRGHSHAIIWTGAYHPKTD